MEKYIADEKRYAGGMEYNRCGRSGVLLPKVSLGFWHITGAAAQLPDTLSTTE